MRICVGIDAEEVTHGAAAVDAEGRVVLDGAVESDPDAIDSLVSDLRALGPKASIGLDVIGSFARFIEAVLLAEGFALVHTPGIVVNRRSGILGASPIRVTRARSRTWCEPAT